MTEYFYPDYPRLYRIKSGYYDGKKAAQAAQRPWVGLTDDEIKEIVGPWGDTPIKGYTRELIDKIEAKLKEKNT